MGLFIKSAVNTGATFPELAVLSASILREASPPLVSIALASARSCLKSLSNIGTPAYVDLASMDRLTGFPQVGRVEFDLGE